MRRESAGILLYAFKDNNPDKLRCLIGHMGGPYHANKDDGSWGIPKGEIEWGEDPFDTACREFEEETGWTLPTRDNPIALDEIQQKGGKYVVAWALRGEWSKNPECHSNTFLIEWPPRSDKYIEVPEIDRVMWVSAKKAKKKMRPAQYAFIERLVHALNS